MSNKKDIGWALLSWSYCCEQANAVNHLFERKSDGFEYGLEWVFFISDSANYYKEIEPLVQSWWDDLEPSRKAELVNNQINETKEHLERLLAYKNEN